LGIVNAYAIATASPRMMGIALGAEDYSANLKTNRTPGGAGLLLAREQIVVAARAAGICCFDTVYSNLDDMETFRKEVELIKTLGFDGKSIINPRQIEVVNSVFTPTEKEINKARAVVAAIKEAQAKGSGVIAVNGKMVDRPVVLRAERTIALAVAAGVISEEELSPDTAPKKQEAPASQEQSQKAKEQTSAITADDLTKIIVQKIKQNRSNSEKIGAILKTYGAAKVSELPPDKYEAFITDVSQL
jgi:hypothetical protein